MSAAAMRRMMVAVACTVATDGAPVAVPHHGASATALFSLDPSWRPALPAGGHTYSAIGISRTGSAFLTQRGNTSVPPVLVLDTKTGALTGGWGSTAVGIATKGNSSTWGSHGVAVEDDGSGSGNVRVWVEDFTGHTVTAFTPTGHVLAVVGTKGVAGNGTDPLQFGNVADAAIVPPSTPGGRSTVYATDGDGGYANRVVKFSAALPPPSTALVEASVTVEWVTPHSFSSPHSIALHQRTNLVVVADRGHNATRLLDAATGKDLGVWNCGLDFGLRGVPFGVRTLARGPHDLVLVASMDNPQDHKYQYIHVLDASKLSAGFGAASPCQVLQTIEIDPAEYSGPHLLGIDPVSADLYAVLVADAPLSTVLRYRFSP